MTKNPESTAWNRNQETVLDSPRIDWSTLSRAKVAKNTFLLEDTTLHFSPPQRLPLGNPLKMTIIEKGPSASWPARFFFYLCPHAPSLRKASAEERDVSRELTLTIRGQINTLSEIEK